MKTIEAIACFAILLLALSIANFIMVERRKDTDCLPKQQMQVAVPHGNIFEIQGPANVHQPCTLIIKWSNPEHDSLVFIMTRAEYQAMYDSVRKEHNDD